MRTARAKGLGERIVLGEARSPERAHSRHHDRGGRLRELPERLRAHRIDLRMARPRPVRRAGDPQARFSGDPGSRALHGGAVRSRESRRRSELRRHRSADQAGREASDEETRRASGGGFAHARRGGRARHLRRASRGDALRGRFIAPAPPGRDRPRRGARAPVAPSSLRHRSVRAGRALADRARRAHIARRRLSRAHHLAPHRALPRRARGVLRRPPRLDSHAARGHHLRLSDAAPPHRDHRGRLARDGIAVRHARRRRMGLRRAARPRRRCFR